MSVDPSDMFAERLLQVIDEGRRTATYKLALILALIDACAAEAGNDGRAPDTLHTRTVARFVLRRYLPQARPFLAAGGDKLELRQITNKQSAVLGAVLRLHLAADHGRVRGFGAIERAIPDEFARCLDEVERTFARYPILRLQVVGQTLRPFLYDVDWSEGVSLAALHKPGGGLLRFRPGAGDHLLRLSPLLRPLVELHWARMVATLNRVDLEEERLREHLFGAERSTFPASLRSGLRDMQDGRCFYCGDTLSNRTQVDHFIPWSRWPNDAVENLVLADACNTHKRDFLPALMHVDRWATRFADRSHDLAELASLSGWDSEPVRSMALVRSCYAHLPAGTPIWVAGHDFSVDDPAAITQRLAGVDPTG